MQQFKCEVAIGWPDFTWSKCEVTLVVTKGICHNAKKEVEQQVWGGLTQPAVFVVVLTITPI